MPATISPGFPRFIPRTRGSRFGPPRKASTPGRKRRSAKSATRTNGAWTPPRSRFQSNPGNSASPEALAEAEIKLSLAVLKYARHARGGRLDPPSLSPVIDRRPHIYDPKSVLKASRPPNRRTPICAACTPSMSNSGACAKRFSLGGRSTAASAPAQIPAGPDFQPGDDNKQIALIRRRLGVSAENKETRYDKALLEAVRRYQKTVGSKSPALSTAMLRASLNETAAPASHAVSGGSLEEKRQRILVNMERWRWMPENLGEFYVWDSVPEQYTRIYDHGKDGASGEDRRRQAYRRRRQSSPRTWSLSPSTPNGPCPKASRSTKSRRGSRPGAAAEAAVSCFSAAAVAAAEAATTLQRLGGLHVSLNGQAVDPELGGLVERGHPALPVHPGRGRQERAGRGEIPLPQQARRLHARHAGPPSVRRRHARLQPWLHARAKPAAFRRGAAGPREGLLRRADP